MENERKEFRKKGKRNLKKVFPPSLVPLKDKRGRGEIIQFRVLLRKNLYFFFANVRM